MRQKTMPGVGEKLRLARRAQDLSLRELAGKANVSASLLSQIESGKVVPSVSSLFQIATALALPINSFFPTDEHTQLPQESPQNAEKPAQESIPESVIKPTPVQSIERTDLAVKGPVVSPQNRKIIELMGGITWERLTAQKEEGIEFIEACYDVGATSGTEMMYHAGREFGVVLQGELQVDLGFEQYILGPGNSIIFDSAVPHRLTNIGQIPVRALWCNFNPLLLTPSTEKPANTPKI
ncbi:MAG TPA: cupin domain-containing protein [Ktedonobacteraceae bacterium]|jgi:transcriptional regulator with XRE-family HTH domain/quercetin dioxygenase-like cupin family protein|nr:cupin domain-containing protein [Ktedonobacteraceae bacterium]